MIDLELNKILSNIKEEWEVGGKLGVSSEYSEIFSNPEKNEIRDIMDMSGLDTFRFIADGERRKVYTASSDIYHYKIAEEMGLGSDYEFRMFSGKGRWDNGKVKVVEYADSLNYSDDLRYDPKYLERAGELYKEVIEGEYDWMEKYNFSLDAIKEVSEIWLEKGIAKLKKQVM